MDKKHLDNIKFICSLLSVSMACQNKFILPTAQLLSEMTHTINCSVALRTQIPPTITKPLSAKEKHKALQRIYPFPFMASTLDKLHGMLPFLILSASPVKAESFLCLVLTGETSYISCSPINCMYVDLRQYQKT